MSSDYQLEDTVFLPFTTRAFATGIPTALLGTPAIDIYEDATATPIITGETLVVSLNSVVGFNMITVTATAATGFNVGGHYTAIIQAGTVGGVSVVGEVVGEFTLDASAAAVDLANGTDGLTALKTAIDGVPTTAEFEARTILAADYFDWTADAVANVTLVATTTTNTDMRGTDSALLAANINLSAGVVESNLLQMGGVVQSATDLKDFADAGYDPVTNKVQGVVLVDTTTTNTDMRGTDSALLAADINLTAGAVDVVTLVTTTTTNTDMRGTDSALLAASAPTNFGDMSITVTTGLVDFTQTAADKVWGTAARILTAATNITSTGGTTFTQTGDSFVRLGAPVGVSISADIAALNDISVADILTTQMTESYAVNGVAPTLAQSSFAIHQMLMQFGIASTAYTVRKLDDTTTAFVVTLDDATNPTDAKRV